MFYNTSQMAAKKRRKPTRKVSPGLFKPVSAALMLKTIVLVAALIVAAIAIVLEVNEPAIWTFLGFIAGYAALNGNVSLR